MNSFLQELESKPTAQQCLVKYLEHVLEYFEKASHLSEDKTYARLRRICEKIQVNLPNFKALTNTTNKLIANCRLKVDDKFEESSVEEILKRDRSQHERNELQISEKMMKLFSDPGAIADPKQRWEKCLNRTVDEVWMRGLLIDEIKSLKQDLHRDESLVSEEVRRIFTKGSKILFFDSYLNNYKVMQGLSESGIEVIVVSTHSDPNSQAKKKPSQKKMEEIELSRVSSVMRKCKGVVLSADQILVNGGILSASGALMIAAVAKKYNVPIMALGRGFSLTQRTVIKQRVLLEHENPLNYFPYHEEMCQKVLIGKRFDYVEACLLTRIVCELGEGAPAGVHSHFKEYYDY